MSSAQTPLIFLVISGVIMVYALATSKKAKNVIKTSVDLARQEEGDEMFGSSALARVIVRRATSINDFLVRVIPVNVRRWIDGRFNKDEIILADGAAFDMVRASVNLVLSGLLIIMGTTMKLPLSTTYVTFIVAMGSSLADRAWSRESAVYRITGVLSVIGAGLSLLLSHLLFVPWLHSLCFTPVSSVCLLLLWWQSYFWFVVTSDIARRKR